MRRLLAATLFMTLLAPRASHAFEVVPQSDVASLAGKTVWVGVPCSGKPDKKPEVPLTPGQELKVVGPGKIPAWAVVTDASGTTLDVMVENLSKTALAYSLASPGKLEELLPRVLAEAFEIPTRLADLWKANDYDLTATEPGHARIAYEKAFNANKNLLHQLVYGRMAKAQILREDRLKWLWTADASVMEAYSEGMKYLEVWKKSDFFKKAEGADRLLSAASGLIESSSTISRLRSELKNKAWLKGLKADVPQTQKDALDKDESNKRTAKISELEGRIGKLRESLPADRAKLGL